ncbi:MAG: hypothetical protein O7G83_06440 [Proteobacteria bacterium]|nr:hypothetical protein [Pseudomonadota bacterium]
MRYLAAVALFLFCLNTGAALAQDWHAFVSREEYFLVSMPAEPEVATIEYTAASGAIVPAKTFTATDNGTVYTATVVHYMAADQADIDAAIEHAVQTFRDRPGEVTYDNVQVMEGLPGHLIYLLNPDGSRTAAGIYMHAGPSEWGGPDRLYILEGTAPPGQPPAIHFSQTFFLLDSEGVRLEYQTDENGQRVRNMRIEPENPGAAYGARDPMTCDSLTEPSDGKPTAARAAELLRCSIEGIGDGSLFLLEDLVVSEVGDSEEVDEVNIPDIDTSASAAVDAGYFRDIDTTKPAYPIRGSLVRYECRRQNEDNAGANCWRYEEPNASGNCYRTTSGEWNCLMSDLALVRTEGVAPPGPQE